MTFTELFAEGLIFLSDNTWSVTVASFLSAIIACMSIFIISIFSWGNKFVKSYISGIKRERQIQSKIG